MGASRPGAGGQCASSVSTKIVCIAMAFSSQSHSRVKREGLPNHSLPK